MLRGSITNTGETFDMAALQGESAGGTIPHERELLALTDAIISRDRQACDALKGALAASVGDRGVADACAVVAAFQGFNRIADSVGTGIDPAQQDMLAPIRDDIGLDGFYRSAEAT